MMLSVDGLYVAMYYIELKKKNIKQETIKTSCKGLVMMFQMFRGECALRTSTRKMKHEINENT